MKKRTLFKPYSMESKRTLPFLLICFILTLTIFYACDKNSASSIRQQWFLYSGNKAVVADLISQLKNPLFSAALVSKCTACTPNWDSSLRVGAIGDTTSSILVPVVDHTGTLTEYIKVTTGKSKRVKSVQVMDYATDYIDNKSLSAKARTANELLALYLRKNKLPGSFSPDSVKQISKRALYAAVRKMLQKNPNAMSKARVATTVAGTKAVLTTDGTDEGTLCANSGRFTFSLDFDDPNCIDIVEDELNETFLENLNNACAQYADGNPSSQYMFQQEEISDDDEYTIDIGLSTTLEDDVQAIVDQALEQTANVFSSECDFTWTDISLNEAGSCISCCLSDPEATPTVTSESVTVSDECGLVGTSPSGLPMKTCTHTWSFLSYSVPLYKWGYNSTETTTEVQVNGAWTFNAVKHVSTSQTGQLPVCVSNPVKITSSTGSISQNALTAEMQLGYTATYNVTCCPVCTPVTNDLSSHATWPPQ